LKIFEMVESLTLVCDGEFLFAHGFLHDGLLHARVGTRQTFGVIRRADARVISSIAGEITRTDPAFERTDHGHEAGTV